jgi:hypothetical protein
MILTIFLRDLLAISLARGFRCGYESDGDGQKRREDLVIYILFDDRSALRQQLSKRTVEFWSKASNV